MFAIVRRARWLISVLLPALLGGMLLAQAPALTPELQKKLDERNQRVLQVNALLKEGKKAEAVKLVRENIAAEREVWGPNDSRIYASLQFLAQLCVDLGDWPQAKTACREAVELQSKLLGKDHWQVTEARLFQTRVEALSQLTAEQRQAISDARKLKTQAAQLDKQNKLREALALYEKVLAVHREVFGEKHPDIPSLMTQLGLFHQTLGENEPAGKYLSAAVELFRPLLGEKHPEFAQSLRRLGTNQYYRGDYIAAEKTDLQCLAIHRQLYGDKDPRTASILNHLAGVYHEKGDVAEAERLARQALTILRQAPAEYESALIGSLIALGMTLGKRAEFEEAEQVMKEALERRRKLHGPRSPEVLNALHNLAGVYLQMADHARAEPLLKEALQLCKELQGDQSQGYADILKNYASLCHERGDYELAERQHRAVQDIYRRVLGENHPATINNQISLALLLLERGQLAEPEAMLRELREGIRRQQPAPSPTLARTLDALARFSRHLGDFEQAAALYEQAREVRRKTVGESHPDYATSLNNLSVMHELRGQRPEAEKLLRESLELRKRLLGEKHLNYVMSLSNLAANRFHAGDFAQAEEVATRSAELFRQLTGERTAQYLEARSSVNMARLAQGKYDEAEKGYRETTELTRTVLGEQHPMFAERLRQQALVSLARGQPAEAEPLLRRALDIQARGLDDAFAVQSEHQRLVFLRQLRHTLEDYLTAAIAAARPAEEIYRHVLHWKGAAGGWQAAELALRAQPELREPAAELRIVRARLAHLAFRQPAPAQRPAWVRQLEDLQAQKEALETRLARASAGYRQARQPLTTGEVSSALPAGAVLIDFLQYLHCTPAAKPGLPVDELRMLAFVLKPNQPPALVSLGPAQALQEAAAAWRAALESGSADQLQGTAERVQSRLGKPLAAHWAGAKTLWLAPDGPLCQVPLAALPGQKPGSYLLEEVAIGQVLSGRHAVECFRAERPAGRGLLALGGVDYAADSAPRGQPSGPVALLDNKTRAAFLPLPGTDLEARAVVRSFEKSFPKERHLLLTGVEADSQRFKDRLTTAKEGWQFIHLATHGFFAPPAAVARGTRLELATSDEQPTLGRSPGLQSGLALAGANRASAREGAASVLTAEETASLDLRGTDIVVLSACDTGRGELAAGEGVLGLQRAFQLAGARTAIASLWRVDDAATTILMEEFYAQHWQKKLPKLEALRQAQLIVLANPQRIEQRRKELNAESVQRGLKLKEPAALPQGGAIGQRSHPAWWAGFVLSGDGR